MKVGYTVWTWGEWGAASRKDFEQAAKEISDLGYETVEDFNRLVPFYEDHPEEFERAVDENGLEFVAIYHYLTTDFEEDMALAERCCKFLKRHGAKILNMEAQRGRESGPSEDDLAEMVRRLTKVGELARDYGVTMSLHPHWGTKVERAHEIAYVAERIDPEIMKFTLDTAHTVLGGMDPVKTFGQYVDRIAYVHLKDLVVPYPDPEKPMSGVIEVGRGIVDFRGVMKVLRDGGYDGVVCVELDSQRICNYKSAMISRQYIREELGL